MHRVPGVIMKKELHHDGSSVTYRSAKLKLSGVTSEIGLSALWNVVEELRVGSGPAITLTKNNALEKTRNPSSAEHFLVH